MVDADHVVQLGTAIASAAGAYFAWRARREATYARVQGELAHAATSQQLRDVHDCLDRVHATIRTEGALAAAGRDLEAVERGRAKEGTMNFATGLSDALTGLAIAGTIVPELAVDAAQIKAKQPATVTLPSIGGSIEGVAGKFTGAVTFTPD